MKERFIIFKRRNGVFYIEDRVEKSQKSLHTRDRREAERLLAAHREAYQENLNNRAMGRVYIKAADPKMAARTWADVFDTIISVKNGETRHRWESARKDEHLAAILHQPLIDATASDFFRVLTVGTVSTNNFLRRVHNFALDMGWLVSAVIPKKHWPPVIYGAKRATTDTEHAQILGREPNAERRAFYEMCWHLGASQSDIAQLTAECIDWSDMTLSFSRIKLRRRRKTSHPIVSIGPKLATLLRSLPSSGLLFPYMASVRSGDRATEFKQRCDGLKITGITLHSYRYSWAERARKANVPLRSAMEQLGHGSKAVHHAYAGKAQVRLKSLEEYEAEADGKIIPFANPEASSAEAISTESLLGALRSLTMRYEQQLLEKTARA